MVRVIGEKRKNRPQARNISYTSLCTAYMRVHVRMDGVMRMLSSDKQMQCLRIVGSIS